MQQNRTLSDSQKQLIKEQLKQYSISHKEISNESGRGLRAISYFLNGDTYSAPIHHAILKILNTRSTELLKAATDSAEVINKLI